MKDSGIPDAAHTLALPLMRIVRLSVDGIWAQAAAITRDPDANAIEQVVAGFQASVTFMGLSGLWVFVFMQTCKC